MAKYQIETSGGTYEVETDEPNSAPQIGGVEAFGRAAVNNLPLGGQIGAAVTGHFNNEDYQKALADWNAKAASAKEQHPVAYGAGAVAGTVAPLAIPGVGELGIGGQAALGAAYGVGNTDLTNVPEAAKDAVIGGVTGGIGGAVAKGLTGAADVAAPYAGRFGENQTIKALGGSGGQIRQMGLDESRALARRAANEYGLLDATMGPIGREETVQAMKEQAGHEIGEIRDSAGAAPTPQEMADKVRSAVGENYGPNGTNWREEQQFERELKGLQALKDPTQADYAQRVTAMNDYASKNALVQPTSAATDVANQLARLNDEGIRAKLPADAAEHYGQLKQTFADMKDLEPLIARGESRSMASRGGNTAFEQGRKFTEELGAHKMAAHAGFGAEKLLQNAGPTIKRGAMATTNGVVSTIMNHIQTNPQSLGKYAAPLMQAAQGGPQGIAATHYVLSLQHPEYNQMWQDRTDNQK